jgi:predicted transcriptional regulator
MTTFRTKKESNFFSIQNKIVIDTKLNDEAFRLYCYLMSNSDDWTIYNGDLMKKLDWTEHKLEKAIKNLKQNGFLERTQKHDKGRYIWETNVYENPQKRLLDQLTIGQITTPCNSTGCITTPCNSPDIIKNKENKNKENKNKGKNIKKENQNLPENQNSQTFKLKEKKPKSNFDSEQYITSLSIDKEVKELLLDWLEIRKIKKTATTQKAIDLALKELNEYSIDIQKKMIEKSIKRGYTGIFAIETQNNTTNYTQKSSNQVGAKTNYQPNNFAEYAI